MEANVSGQTILSSLALACSLTGPTKIADAGSPNSKTNIVLDVGCMFHEMKD